MSTPSSDPWTIRRIVRWSAEDFGKRGIDSPRLDAELLVAHALRVDRVRLYMDLDRELSNDELGAIRELVQRRRKREPVAYLLGKKEFWGRSFAVSRAVLVPRPDTETLVERALALIAGVDAATGIDVVATQAEHVAGLETYVEPEPELRVVSEASEASEDAAPADAQPSEAPVVGPPVTEGATKAARSEPMLEGKTVVRVLDLCTGSGAIGLTIACEVPWARVTITDVSAPALEIARTNLASFAAADASLTERVSVREGDLLAALPEGARFELVLCNPPYLAERELAECEPDVREHEPKLALVSGPNGDETIVRLLAGVKDVLTPGGTLLVEIGASQGAHVKRLFERAGLAHVRVLRDLGDRDRVVEGHLSG